MPWALPNSAHTTELSELEEGQVCTVDFHRGRLASDMGEDMDTTLTDAIEKGKRAEAIEMAKGEDMDTIATDVIEKGKTRCGH